MQFNCEDHRSNNHRSNNHIVKFTQKLIKKYKKLTPSDWRNENSWNRADKSMFDIFIKIFNPIQNYTTEHFKRNYYAIGGDFYQGKWFGYDFSAKGKPKEKIGKIEFKDLKN